MRRLSIIDLAGGHQPLVERGRHALAGLQRRDLQLSASCARELERAGPRFRTGSDSEMLLHGYEQWGDEFVAAAERHVRLRAVGRAAAAARPRPRPARDQADVRLRRRTTADRSPRGEGDARAAGRSRRASMPTALHVVPGLRLRARARNRCFSGIRKLPPATLLVVRERARRASAATGAYPARIDRAADEASGSSACANASTRRCACRW